MNPLFTRPRTARSFSFAFLLARDETGMTKAVTQKVHDDVPLLSLKVLLAIRSSQP